MNSKFHKTQAEELIKLANKAKSDGWLDEHDRLVSMALVHATLANVPDEEEYHDLGPL